MSKKGQAMEMVWDDEKEGQITKHPDEKESAAIIHGKDGDSEILKIVSHPASKPFHPPVVRSGEKKSIAISFGTLVRAVYEGTIIPYEWNRGKNDIIRSGEVVIRKTINGIRDEFRPLIFGHPVVCLDQKTGICKIGDGHQRIIGIEKRARAGKLKEVADEFILDVGHMSDHLLLYCNINGTQPHTPAERVLNIDLASGFLLSNILNKCQIDPKGLISTKLCYNMLYALWVLYERKKRPFHYWEIFGGGKNIGGGGKGWAKELTNIPANNAPEIKDEHYLRVAGAFDYYLEWKREIKAELLKTGTVTTEDKQMIMTVLNSAPLCGMMMLDILSGDNYLVGVKGPKAFSKRCLANKSFLSRQTPAITHGGMSMMQDVITGIFKKLAPKTS